MHSLDQTYRIFSLKEINHGLVNKKMFITSLVILNNEKTETKCLTISNETFLDFGFYTYIHMGYYKD